MLQLLQEVTVDAHAREQGPAADRPLLAPWLRRLDDGGRILLEYGDELIVLGGGAATDVLPALLARLDGTHTVEEAAALADVEPERARQMVAVLAAHGVVVPGPSADEAATLCAALAPPGTAPADAGRRLHAARVAVVGASACAAELVRLLEPCVGDVRRIGWSGEAVAADAAVVAPAPHELPRLEAWNARMLELRRPWLQVLPFNGRVAALGPLYVPHETCCFACFRARRVAALGDPAFELLDAVPARYPQGGPLAAALAGLAVTLLLRWLAVEDAAVPATLFALELADGVRIDAHRVLRVPRCPACSVGAAAAPPLPWQETCAA